MQIERTGLFNINRINLIAGIWLIISPFALAYVNVLPAVWNNLVVGILLILITAYALFTRAQLEWIGWTMLALGVWEIIAPFVLDFAGISAALWNNIILGVIIGVVGAWSARCAWQRTSASR